MNNGSLQSLCYWDGYIAALEAVKEEADDEQRQAEY